MKLKRFYSNRKAAKSPNTNTNESQDAAVGIPPIRETNKKPAAATLP